jgi:hypothetical protein
LEDIYGTCSSANIREPGVIDTFGFLPNRWIVAVFVSISSALAGLFVTDKRPGTTDETMSMQELAAVQPPLQSLDTAARKAFPVGQHGGRRDSQEMIDFQATNFTQS